MNFKIEDYIKIPDVLLLVKKITGQTRTRATAYNWIKDGKRSYSGEKVHLRAKKRMGQMYTTERWVRDFLGKL